jgi:UDP-N-acetylmuramoylalanine--D-glutamate ligase
MKEKIIEHLKSKGKILILGFGREGKSTYNLIRSIDSTIIIGIADLKEITDEKVLSDNNVVLHIGDNYLDSCNSYDVIVKGPGVIIKDYLSEEVRDRITCQTDLFVKFCSAKMIGITGTKGKSTTSSLMYHILKNIGKKTILMGNIGIPVFDTIDDIDDDTICVMELGCHQLEYMKNSPNISVVLNIYEEHLDHYLSMQHYVDSKKNIYRYQKENDFVLLGNSPYLNDSDIISTVIRNDESFNNSFYLTDNELVINYNSSIHIPKSNIITKLKGEHNLFNILVCLTIINILGFDIDESIKTIESFDGLHHRMECVGTFNGVTYYDDSIATSIPSVIYAVKSLEKVDTIIIGGMDRGLDYTDLVNYLNESSVNNILLLPDTNKRIHELFIGSTKNIIDVKDMVEAVSIAKKVTEKGKICLLSPAAASYGFYKNFEERGDHFTSLVKENNS